MRRIAWIYKAPYLFSENSMVMERIWTLSRKKKCRSIKKKAEELFQTIKKKTSKILNITDIMADGNGELRLILHTDKKEGTRTQQQKIAEELIKTYPELFSFQRGDIQTSCNISMGNGTMICETEIFQAEDDDKKRPAVSGKRG